MASLMEHETRSTCMRTKPRRNPTIDTIPISLVVGGSRLTGLSSHNANHKVLLEQRLLLRMHVLLVDEII